MKLREIGENYIMKSFVTVLFTKYSYSDQVNEDEIGRAYSMNGTRRNAYRI
jgi:hypothetical protein